MTVFSIVTVTKNNPDGFARTRDSITMQSFADYDWIVIDGEREPDGGIYDAMNKGLDRARGQYTIFMNAGDTFASSDTLKIVAGNTGADFLYGNAIEDGHIKPARHDIALGMITHHQAMVYRRATIANLRYDTQYHIASDYKFTAEFLKHARTRMHIPAPLCIFETGGVSQVKAALGRREQALIRKELGIRAPGIQAAQIAAQTLKSIAPKVYWTLRKRLNTSAA